VLAGRSVYFSTLQEPGVSPLPEEAADALIPTLRDAGRFLGLRVQVVREGQSTPLTVSLRPVLVVTPGKPVLDRLQDAGSSGYAARPHLLTRPRSARAGKGTHC